MHIYSVRSLPVLTLPSHQGTGLFISKSVVEAHVGRIWAKNGADRRGATFIFTLPIIDRTLDAEHNNQK